MGGGAHDAVEEVAGLKAGKGEVWLGLFGGEGLEFVELFDESAIKEGKEARMGRKYIRVVGGGHFDGDVVGHQLQVVV